MRVFFLALFLCLRSMAAHSQTGSEDCSGIDASPVDSVSFEDTGSSLIQIVFDTSFDYNIWQPGAVQKPGFSSAFSGLKTLQTDTLNVYPIGNESAVIVYLDSQMFANGGMQFSMLFWHYYDTDTLTDSCILQMTVDSGRTWMDYVDFAGVSSSPIHAFYCGSLNHYCQSFYTGDRLLWTGNSGGWKKEAICIVFPGVKGQVFSRNYGFRFLFHADSLQTNKPGWMIDNILVKTPFRFPGVKPLSNGDGLRIFPNPSMDGIFSIDYPYHHVRGTVDIFSILGQRVLSVPLSRSLDISDLPRGSYFYSILFENTGQLFRGKLDYR